MNVGVLQILWASEQCGTINCHPFCIVHHKKTLSGTNGGGDLAENYKKRINVTYEKSAEMSNIWTVLLLLPLYRVMEIPGLFYADASGNTCVHKLDGTLLVIRNPYKP